MPQPEKSEREKALETLVVDLAGKLAASQSYVHAIHCSVDPLRDLERGKAKIIDGLCHAAETAVFHGHPKYCQWILDSHELIEAQREGMVVDVRKTKVFEFLNTMILDIAREQFDAAKK